MLHVNESYGTGGSWLTRVTAITREEHTCITVDKLLWLPRRSEGQRSIERGVREEQQVHSIRWDLDERLLRRFVSRKQGTIFVFGDVHTDSRVGEKADGPWHHMGGIDRGEVWERRLKARGRDLAFVLPKLRHSGIVRRRGKTHGSH